MKNLNNLKNTAAAFGLMTVMAFGSVAAQAGVIISDKNGAQPCGSVKGSLLSTLSGIFVAGLPMFDGIIITGRSGILVSDRDGILISDKGGCASKDGVIVSDRTGVIVSDRTGVIVSD